jgi:hypothetical protein
MLKRGHLAGPRPPPQAVCRKRSAASGPPQAAGASGQAGRVSDAADEQKFGQIMGKMLTPDGKNNLASAPKWVK